MIEKVTTDFETQSECDLKKSGAYEYSMHPTTIALCLGFKSDLENKDFLLGYDFMQKKWSELPIVFRDKWRRWILDETTFFSAHNAFFEQCIYNNVLVARLGWPAIPASKWRCTAAKAAAVAIPRNLDGAGQVMKLTTQKSYEGHRIMLKLCKPTRAWSLWKKELVKAHNREQHWKAKELLGKEPLKFWTPETAPEDFKGLYKYCRIDVKTEELLDQALPDLTPMEQKLWYVDQKINLRGTLVDMPLVNKIVGIMKSESKILGKELDSLTIGLVSSGNARAAILDFLSLEGLELPDLKAKTVDDFLKNGKATGDAKTLLEIRRALSKASTAKYQKFQNVAASDGRARDLFLFHAASTGRWGGKNVQPQNFPRGIIKDIEDAICNINTCSLDELKLLYGENLMPLFSSVLRGMFIPTPGRLMFIEDYSAIELRVLFWLADHQEGLQLFRDGVDAYKVGAADIYDKSVIEITDDERQVGKAAELGCGYQMGHKKFVTSAWDVYRAKVTPELAKIAVTSFRKRNWPVVELWDNYNNAAINAIENPGATYPVGPVSFQVKNSFLWVTLPSGRALAYKDPEVEIGKVVVMVNGEATVYAQNASMYNEYLEAGYVFKSSFNAKKVKYMAVNQKARKEDCIIPKWTRETIYGGKWAENIVQGTSRDLLAESIVRAEENGFDVLMHSHDELVSEAPIGLNDLKEEKGKMFSPAYRGIMEMLPAWADGLPLKASGWAGPRYKKG